MVFDDQLPGFYPVPGSATWGHRGGYSAAPIPHPLETHDMVASSSELRFDYDFSPINDLEVVSEPDPKSGRPMVKHVLVKDEPLQASDRFWTSLFARYGFNKAFFKYFRHDEVFDRISDVETADRMRLCIERRTDDQGATTSTLLAVSNPTKPIVQHDELMDTLTSFNGQSVDYANGEVYSTHSPRIGASNFDIKGDVFSNRFVMTTPIDGYGSPNFYLSLLRQVCDNGMIGYAKAFRSSLNLGKGNDDVMPTITRALDGFGNDEGFAALRQRMESATESWASVFETASLYKLLVRLHSNKGLTGIDKALAKGTTIADWLVDSRTSSTNQSDLLDESEGIGSPIISAFHQMTGDTNHLYGLANLDALSIKRQRTLPVNCTIYDAINFATEVSTHYAIPGAARLLNAWVGSLISAEYDMEGTMQQFSDFNDFHIEAKMGAKMTGSEFSS